MECWICVCSGFGIKCDTFCVLFAAAIKGSPHKRARMSKAQREVRECASVRELWNLTDNSLVNFTGALLDMSDLRYVETRQAGRDCMSAHFQMDLQNVPSVKDCVGREREAECIDLE